MVAKDQKSLGLKGHGEGIFSKNNNHKIAHMQENKALARNVMGIELI